MGCREPGLGGGKCSLPLVVKRLVLSYGCLGGVGSLRTGAGSFSSLCAGVAQSLRQGQFWLERWPSYPLKTPPPPRGPGNYRSPAAGSAARPQPPAPLARQQGEWPLQREVRPAWVWEPRS